MRRLIEEKVIEARKAFGLDAYPGNLFELFYKDNNFDKFKMFIFKEDLDKLCGFISYVEDVTFIGINYKRPIGCQNLSLAHEIGHMFLHYGSCFSDLNCEQNVNSKDSNERDAFDFGFELLYPNEMQNIDFLYANKNKLFLEENAEKLGIYINELCHKYFLSFNVILRRMLYKNFNPKDYEKKRQLINQKLGYQYTQLDPNFHISNGSLYSVKSNEPYDYLKKLVTEAIKEKAISQATGESILFTYDLLED